MQQNLSISEMRNEHKANRLKEQVKTRALFTVLFAVLTGGAVTAHHIWKAVFEANGVSMTEFGLMWSSLVLFGLMAYHGIKAKQAYNELLGMMVLAHPEANENV